MQMREQVAVLLQRLNAAGVTVQADGSRLVLDGPDEALTDTLVAEVRQQKAAILAYLQRVEAVAQARLLRLAWQRACFELAEALNWPHLPIAPHLTIPPGEVPWRLYLQAASVAELRDRTLPALRKTLAGVGLPPREG